MEKLGLNLKNKENNLYKSYSLKKFGTQIDKKELKLNTPNIVNKFKFVEQRENDNKMNNKNLIKANNTIINIISNCFEKIQNENNNDENINSNLNGDFKNQLYNKENKRKNKKQVKFNDNNNHFHRLFSKKSQKSPKSKNSLNKYIKHISSNKFNKEQNKLEQNGIYHRILTTSHLPKEKEKEIVTNISSSLISLYKVNREISKSSFDKSKFNNLRQRRFSCKASKFKKTSKANSKEEHYNSSLSNDSQKMKKYLKPKSQTFIELNKNKQKKLKCISSHLKNKKHKSECFFQDKNDLLSSGHKLGNNLIKKGSDLGKNKINKCNEFKIKNWKTNLKDNENLTEREYVHIQQDLKQSLIGYKNTKLEEEMKNLEKTETTDLIKRLPTLKRIDSNVTKYDNTISKDNIKFDKEKFRFLQHTGYVYDSLDDEEVEDAIDINYYYISPDSIFIYIFDTIIAILSFYCIYYFPYYLAHDSFYILYPLKIKIIIFYIIDIFYIFDLIISFFRAYFNYDEILVINIPDMCYNYINNWFFIDLFSAIPFYSILYFIEQNDNNINSLNKNNSICHSGIKIYKMYYLLMLNKLIKIFKCFSENNRALSKLIQILLKNDRIEEKSDILLIIFILISACNFGTCIFIFIGRNSYPSWMNAMKFDNKSFFTIYISSLYYLIATITTVGYGDIYGRTVQEILFQIILLLIGTFTYSYLISSVANFVKKINEKSLIFENKLKILNDIKLTNPYMKDYLYEKILRFLRYKKNTEKNKQKIIIDDLPYSLKNSLIIEMYKSIINNFRIFKGLENSNCIVQLVTAFKPIYAIKNDILIQEGDVIEEVIFVKTGIISLEIGIDLNNPKESIIQFLDRNDGKDKSFTQSNIGIKNMTYHTISSTSSFIQANKTTIKNEALIKKNTHYLKVLDIRKNENFGETLMFLNERSFLTAKVKSKKAELFFLEKEEVIKIFNAFPNIWNRINRKSIYNMKQIKKTVTKVLLKFCSLIGININDEIKKDNRRSFLIKNLNKYPDNKLKKKKNLIKKGKELKKNSLDKYHHNLVNNDINNFTIKNNDSSLSIIKSISITVEKNNEKEEKKNEYKLEKEDNKEKENDKKLKLFINIDAKNNDNITKNSKENLLHFETNLKSTQISQNFSNNNSNKIKHYQTNDINVINKTKGINNGFSCFKEPKCNSSKFGEDTNEYNEKNNKDKNSTETVKMSINKKANLLIDSDSLKEKKEFNNIYQNSFVNDEIYENEIFNLNSEYKDDLLKKKIVIKSYLNNNTKIETLSRKILEQTWLKNLDKEKINYLEKLLNKPQLKELNNDSKKESEYNSFSCESWILSKSNIESFIIKSSYENINEITSNKYINNNALRKKTKEFLLKECIYENENNHKISESKISSDFNFFKKIVNDKRNTLITTSKVKSKETDIINKSDIFPKNIDKKIISRVSMPDFKHDNKIFNKKSKLLEKNSLYNNKKLSLKHLSNNYLPYIKKGKNMKKPSGINLNYKQDKLNKSFKLNNFNEMSFYDKYNISHLNYDNYDSIDEKPSKKRKKHGSAYDEIKHNFQQDAQNLNQPSLYYKNLFFNQIHKVKYNNKTILPSNISKSTNNVNMNIRRISTSRESNDFKKNGLFLKRNIQKSCKDILSSLKKV